MRRARRSKNAKWRARFRFARPYALSCLQDAELLQRRCAVVEPDLFGDLAVLDAQNGRSRKAHFPARAGGKRADDEVIEGRPGMRAAAFPSADHVVALGDQVRRTPEIQVWERAAEPV